MEMYTILYKYDLNHSKTIDAIPYLSSIKIELSMTSNADPYQKYNSDKVERVQRRAPSSLQVYMII